VGEQIDMSNIIRTCKICSEHLEQDEKGLQSVMDGHWICKPCFEIKLGHKI